MSRDRDPSWQKQTAVAIGARVTSGTANRFDVAMVGVSKLRIILMALLGYVLLLAPVSAQPDEPAPPSVSLTGVRYDADRNIYQLDLVMANHEAIGSLSVTLSNDAGVQVRRRTVPASGPSQILDLDAAGLIIGQTYRLEAIAFAPDGSALVSGQGRPVSAEREFVHAPNLTGVQIGPPLFAIDREAKLLTIAVQAVDGGAIASYRVILEDQATNLAVLEHQVDAASGPSVTVSLEGVGDGEYLAVVQALDADGALLAVTEDVFVYQQLVPVIGRLHFSFDDDAGDLQVETQLGNRERVEVYKVSIIDPDTNTVLVEYKVQPADVPPFVVPLGQLPAGKYGVEVAALDAAGQTLATAASETVYNPPKPPGFLAKVANGLKETPLIPVAIILIAVAVSAWLMFRWLWEKHISGTPVLQEGGLRAAQTQVMPFHQTSIVSGHRSPAQSSDGRPLADVPRLAVTIEAFPDRHRVGERVPVTRFPFSIGRGDCSLDLSADTSVSRHHAEIRFSQRGLYIIDMLSANGTYVNDERIPSQAPVSLDPAQQTSIRVGEQTRLILKKHT